MTLSQFKNFSTLVISKIKDDLMHQKKEIFWNRLHEKNMKDLEYRVKGKHQRSYTSDELYTLLHEYKTVNKIIENVKIVQNDTFHNFAASNDINYTAPKKKTKKDYDKEQKERDNIRIKYFDGLIEELKKNGVNEADEFWAKINEKRLNSIYEKLGKTSNGGEALSSEDINTLINYHDKDENVAHILSLGQVYPNKAYKAFMNKYTGAGNKKKRIIAKNPLQETFEKHKIEQRKKNHEFEKNHMRNRFTYKEVDLYGQDEITGHNISMIQMFADKFNTRDKFYKNEPEAYQAAIRFNELDRICKHMVPVLNLTKEEIYKKVDSVEYIGTLTLDIMEEIRRKRMVKDVKEYLHRKKVKQFELEVKEDEYIKNNIQNIANYYKSRNDFRRGYYKAYSYARQTSEYDNICFHMKPSGGFDKRKKSIFYVIKVGNLYKIGITNYTVYERYRREDVKYNVIAEEVMMGSDALKKEQLLMKKFKSYQYQGPSPFKYTGITELYTENITIIE